jgi:hypothetical protein
MGRDTCGPAKQPGEVIWADTHGGGQHRHGKVTSEVGVDASDNGWQQPGATVADRQRGRGCGRVAAQQMRREEIG